MQQVTKQETISVKTKSTTTQTRGALDSDGCAI